ncbi:MAG: Histidinol-phosphate phosphatase, partial [uncultured bacterium]
LSCTDHNDASKHQNGEAYNAFIKNVKMYRNWGDCYMYTLLAQGKIDIAIDPIMNLWDIQALIPIVKGAGGVITDYQGKSPLGANSIIASNPLLHDKVIKLLNP